MKIGAQTQIAKRGLPVLSAPLILCCLIIISSAAITCGWILHLQLLERPLIGLITIKANTAFGFLLSGLSLFCLIRGAHGPAKILGLFITTIGVVSLIENWTGFNMGIDEILVRDPTCLTGAPGRMAQHTASGFTAVGAAIIFSEQRHSRQL